MPRKNKNKKSSGTGNGSTQELAGTQQVNTLDLLECSLCNNQYDDSKRRARTLACMHYFCQECLNKIIKSDTPRCATCRELISINSAEMLPPNFLMDDLISKMKTGLRMSFERIEEDFSAGLCANHKKNHLYFNCKTHNVQICRDCTVLDHNPSKCKIISIEDELKETKKKTISDLKTQQTITEKNISDLQNIITDTDSKLKDQKEEIAKLQKASKENEQVLTSSKEVIQNLRENNKKLEKILQELIPSLTMNEINDACNEAECIIKAANSFAKTSNLLEELIDQRPDEFERKILNGEITVQTTAEINGEKRFSKLLVKNGKIHLPALSSCVSSPANEETVNVSSLLTRYPSTSANLYLILATEKGNELGIVYIKLNGTDYAKYVRKLFMGTIGPSFRGAIIDGRGGNNMWTQNITKYDSSMCSENAPPLPAQVEVRRGTVYCAPEVGLGFVVYVSHPGGMDYTNIRGINCGCVIGEAIEESIDVVGGSRNYLTGEVFIKDVGIVLKSN